MIQKPKGTKDVLLDEIDKWTCIENVAYDTFEKYGYKEVRVPTFEYTELFETLLIMLNDKLTCSAFNTSLSTSI